MLQIGSKKLAMRSVFVLLFMALSIETTHAQSGASRSHQDRAPYHDNGLNAAIGVSAGIDFMFKRLSVCTELDIRNSATYLLISTEYLRDKTVGDAISKTEHIIDTEMRSIARNSEDVERAKTARKQAIDELYQKRRQEALANPTQFQQDCRRLAQKFLLRSGPFRPLRILYPKEMNDIDIWYIWQSVERCFTDANCRQ
jgi:hypothetical protein